MVKVEYEKSHFKDKEGNVEYTLYFFYIRKKYDGDWCWLWDDDKLLLEEALKKYPTNKYEWVDITGLDL